MDYADDEGGMADADLVLNIDLPDEVEDALASVDVSEMGDVHVDLADVNLGGSDADVDAGPPADLAPDLDADAAVADVVGEPDMVDVVSHDSDEPELHDEGMYQEQVKRGAILEAKLKKAAGVLKTYKSETPL